MIIFNLIAVFEAFFAAFPAFLVGGFVALLGFNPVAPFLVTLGLAFALTDVGWRYLGGLDRPDGEGGMIRGRGVLNFLLPWGGGHLFFVPSYLIGTAIALLFAYAGVMSFFV
ncbi:MAG: hypothetical protein H6737_21480 [Alphaproteobacteria bacterium]|nr:hypothetical protein [Alphaproteobacteria bacterium]